MSETKLAIEAQQQTTEPQADQIETYEKVAWETPRLEDVSEEVLTQYLPCCL